MAMFVRSGAEKRARTQLSKSMEVRSKAPVRRGHRSFWNAKWSSMSLLAMILVKERRELGHLPSVRSIETLFAYVSKHPLISFSHPNPSLGYPSTVSFNK